MIRELFPDPETPVMQVIIPRGISTSICLRLFSAAPLTSQITGRFLSYFRNRDFQFSAEICSCNGLRILHKFLSSAHSNKLSTMFSCAGSDIYNTVAARMVSSSCSTTIRLFPRSLKCIKAPRSLSLSSDADQYLAHPEYRQPRQGRNRSGSKTDSLCLSARQSTSGTCQGKVLQTYICQEPHSGSDLL